MLEEFARWITYTVLGITERTQLGTAVEFFIYDSIKVTILLAAMIFIVAIIRTYVTRETIRKTLGGKREGVGNVIAAGLGIPTPFCSCSAVPLFMGLIEAGVPLGVTFSFLIACPLINEVAIALLLALFGFDIALIYVAAGFVIAVMAGIIIGRLGLESEVESMSLKKEAVRALPAKSTLEKRLSFALFETQRITIKTLPFILLGIGIGAAIHGYVPANFLSSIAGKDNPFAVPIAVLAGIPIYSNAVGALPIISALISKGMPVGTALALMMSIVGLSLPELVMLRRVLKPKLIAVFVLTLSLAFVAVGYFFNFILMK